MTGRLLVARVSAIKSTRGQILQLPQCMEESIIGQEQVIERILLTLLGNGNLLLEGLPGLAKTRVEIVTGGQLTDAELQALWLRRVQTKPTDFLRAKFAYQLSRRPEEKPQP